MGFFNSDAMKSLKDSVDFIKEKTTSFKGETTQRIGIIPQGVDVTLKLDSTDGVLIIAYTKTQKVTLVFERIMGFMVEQSKSYETDQASNIAGAILSGGALGRGVVGQVGRLAGGILSAKQNEIVHWVATLHYKNKNGEQEELHFIEKSSDGYYEGESKSTASKKFENAINKIAIMSGDNLTEL